MPKSKIQSPTYKIPKCQNAQRATPKSRIQNAKSQAQDLKPKTILPVKTQSAKPTVYKSKGVQSLESQTQNPEAKVPGPKLKMHNPKLKIQNPKSKAQRPNAEVQSPKSAVFIWNPKA